MPSNSKSNSSNNNTPHDGVQNKVIKKMDKETMESKLEKLRTKFGKQPKENQKKPPIMVEAHQGIAPEKLKKDGVVKAEEVMERLSIWITPKTVQYIDEQSAAATQSSTSPKDEQSLSPTEPHSPTENMSHDEDEHIDEHPNAEEEEEEKDGKKKKVTKEKSAKQRKTKNSEDQHTRCVKTVLSGLKKAWVSYVGQLKIGYPVKNVKNLISTFSLDKDNAVIDPKMSEYFATAILQIMTHCDNNLKELLQRKETLEYHQRYYELLEIDFDFFDTKLAELIASKRQELVESKNDEESK